MFYMLIFLAVVNIAVIGHMIFEAVRDYQKIKNWSQPLHDKELAGEKPTQDDMHEALAHALAIGQVAAFSLAGVLIILLTRAAIDFVWLLSIKS